MRAIYLTEKEMEHLWQQMVDWDIPTRQEDKWTGINITTFKTLAGDVYYTIHAKGDLK